MMTTNTADRDGNKTPTTNVSEHDSDMVDSGYLSDKEDAITAPESSDDSPTDFSSGETDDTSESDWKSTPTPEERITMAVAKSELFHLDERASGNRSSSESSLSIDSDTSDENKWDVKYLQKKQRLMKRASDFVSQEKAYDASVAKATVSKSSIDSPLWAEAKELVAVLCERLDGVVRTVSQKRNQSSLERLRSRKRKLIDLSTVCHMYSRAMDNGVILLVNTLETSVSVFSPVHTEGMWLARILSKLWRVPSGEDSNRIACREQWNIHSDPYSGIVSTVPKNFQPNESKSLDEAMRLTHVAQLITQSVPPFVVVHANRSFSALAGIMTENVIGRPVESILQVDPENSIDGTTQVGVSGYSATLKNQSMDPTASSYRMHVIPVMDKTATSKTPISLGRMSHVLIQIEPVISKSADGDAFMRAMSCATYRGSSATTLVGDFG